MARHQETNQLNAAASAGNVSELLEKNLLTTAGLATGALTAGFGGAVLITALPTQTLGGAAITATLLYAGDRQAKGNPLFGKKKDEADASTEATAAEAA